MDVRSWTDGWRPRMTEEVWWPPKSRQKREVHHSVDTGLRVTHISPSLMLPNPVLQLGGNPKKKWEEQNKFPKKNLN